MGPRSNSKYLHNSISDAGRKCAGWPYISVSPMAKSLVSVIIRMGNWRARDSCCVLNMNYCLQLKERGLHLQCYTVCGGMNAFTTLCLWSVGRWQKFIVALASFSVENSISVVDMAWWSIPCSVIGKSFFVKKCFILLPFK